ncbi:protein YIPF6 isoform X4 [Rhineura floridana]|uniref:protein YIPF6 isoform X4 n=1 Tax=Rhineura floridana TaxID=261503 RepID=UPI002AC86F09|nr:protein YIPF6 isoform X4 [Rhineura floridana]
MSRTRRVRLASDPVRGLPAGAWLAAVSSRIPGWIYPPWRYPGCWYLPAALLFQPGLLGKGNVRGVGGGLNTPCLGLQLFPQFAGLADISISEDIPVEGEITVPVGSHSPDEDYSTLDEPVKDTVMRDLKAVGKKFIHVMYPKKSSALLRDWDLWGPLVLCVLLALMLQGGAADSTEDRGPQFAEVFVIIWFGAVVITLNSKLLGGTIIYCLPCR